MGAKFQQNILNFVVVGARQSFQFFRQIAWFLGNNRALSKFRYRILYNLISITKLQKNHSIKADFNLTTRATLKRLCILSLQVVSNIFRKSLKFLTNLDIPTYIIAV